MRSISLRRQVLNNPLGAPVLLAIERKLGVTLIFERIEGVSEWDPNEHVIRVGQGGWTSVFRVLNGGDWSHRLLFHELGHAFLDTFKSKLDRAAFRRLFNGPLVNYSAEASDVLLGQINGNVSVTRYGKSHPEEAFAEAFSYAVCTVDDSDLDDSQIRQLVYVDWMIDCVKRKRARWGHYRGYSCEIDCPVCGEPFDLSPCRLNLDITGWEFECPYCGERLVGV